MNSPSTETVTLTRGLEHRGLWLPDGSKIDVRQDQKMRLARNGYIDVGGPQTISGPQDLDPQSPPVGG